MTLYFGLELDEEVFPYPLVKSETYRIVGPQNILLFFEAQFGLTGHPANNEHLRIAQYRQALKIYYTDCPECFFAQSFKADQLATAAALLSMRDELLLNGWTFEIEEGCPPRLHTIAKIEYIIQNNEAGTPTLSPGYADRFHAVLQQIDKRRHTVKKVCLNEPFHLLPVHFQQLFNLLKAQQVPVEELSPPSAFTESDLGKFQQIIAGGKNKGPQLLSSDGSLLILRSARETEAAAFLAALFKHNPSYKPLCLVPEKNRALDNAFLQEGLPSLGILSASLARPMLQILKLVTTFLWEPIDPFKILEFVSMSVKPLHDELATRIAQQIAQTPGLQGEGWYITINRFFEDLKKAASYDKNINVNEIREQYNFWFERKRYDVNSSVPVKEVVSMFDYLASWAYDKFDEGAGKNSSLAVLGEQAKRVKDLLLTLPDTEPQLSYLELERIVRTIYEPSPVLFRPKEVGHLSCVFHSSAILDDSDYLLWWNFTRHEREHFFSRWYNSEIFFLKQKNITTQGPAEDNARLLWQRTRPVLFTKKQLILIIPNQLDGEEVYPHPLHDQMEASFPNLADVTIHLDQEEGRKKLSEFFQLPAYQALEQKQLGQPPAFIRLKNPRQLSEIGQQTYSSLDALFYYPYQWLFRYQLELRRSSILSIVNDHTLKGNLAHRVFEQLLRKDNIGSWGKSQLTDWIDQNIPKLLAREGAVLLMYGREPERVAFVNKLKFAAWSLVSQLHQNGWQVSSTEIELEGLFGDRPIKAKADLVLQRGDENAIIDLKWRGASRRENAIRNEEDLQLIMYARLLGDGQGWPHSCYFIIENGRLIARNNGAFQEVVALCPEADHNEVNERIWQKMEATYHWRLQQIAEGKIEVRTEHSLPELELEYAGQWEGLLEMRDSDAPFDDYRTLISF